MRRLLRLVPVRKGQLLLAIAAGVGSSLSGIALLGLAAWMLSHAASHPHMVELSLAAVVVRALALSRAGLRYVERVVSHDVVLRWASALRVAVYMRLVPRVPMFTSDRRETDVLDETVNDVDVIGDVIVRGIAPLLSAMVCAMVLVGWITLVLPAALGLVLTGILLSGFALPLIGLRLQRRSESELICSRADLLAGVVDVIDGHDELVVAGTSGEFISDVLRIDRALHREQSRRALASGFVQALNVALGGVVAIAVLAVAVASSLDRELLATVCLCVLGVFEVLGTAPDAVRQCVDASKAAQRIVTTVDADIAVPDPVDPFFVDVPTVVEARELRLRYPASERDVVHAIDLQLRPGRRVAIVGPSGTGKSTIAQALVRFLAPSGGHITADGVDALEVSGDNMRASIALVDQRAHVFAGTLLDNVRMAKPSVSEAELESVARQVGLDGWIAGLPDGWNTYVGERGLSMSGGQHRRLCVARALLSDASILLFDEPTEHLDAESAELVMAAIDEVRDERTVLLITHRLGEVRNFDEINVLRDGTFVERGTHEQLMEDGGWYATHATKEQQSTIAG